MLTDNGGIILRMTNIMMRQALRWGPGCVLGCVLLFALSGCGGLGGHFGAGGVDFTLSASPGSQAVTAGGVRCLFLPPSFTRSGRPIFWRAARGAPSRSHLPLLDGGV